MSKWIYEKVASGEFITWEVNQAYTREKVEVDNALADVLPGTVLVDIAGKFRGIVVNVVKKGRPNKVAAIVRGQAIVILDLLIFPTAVDGPDSGSDAVAETAALRTSLLADMKALGIIARN